MFDYLAALVMLFNLYLDASSQLLLCSFQECNDAVRDAPRSGLPGIATSLLSAFGAVALTSLQPLSHDGGSSKAAVSRWQPSYYVSPDASYQADVAAPASTFKGDTSATRRAATVAAGNCRADFTQPLEHFAEESVFLGAKWELSGTMAWPTLPRGEVQSCCLPWQHRQLSS